ncbi:MAG: histidinol-phosphate transaminase [Deltaproteobacteria bacterium]|nr:histidinol-phosphate transaminase [Deltaproteobacteria bacterium]
MNIKEQSTNTNEVSVALGELRKSIDEIDDRLVELLKQRAALALEIAAAKAQAGKPTYIPERELEVLERVTAGDIGPMPEESLRIIFREIMSASRALQRSVGDKTEVNMLPLVNDAFLTLKPYIPGKPVSETKRELGLTDVIKLASNENPYGPSPKAISAATLALEQVNDYPDGGAFYLRQALAKHWGLDAKNFVVGNGTNEIIEMVVHTFLRHDENLLYTNPSFVIYKLAAQAIGCAVKEVPATADLRHDLKALARAVEKKTKLVFLDNPNNPTGGYNNRAELEAFFNDIPDDVVVVLDEAYFEYATAKDYPSGFDYLNKRQRLLVMRTFSKCYGLAGMRVGYAVGNFELIEYINRGRQPFNVNSVAQAAAIAAIEDHEHVEKSVQQNHQEMVRMLPLLRSMGLKVYDSQANFLLVDFHRDGEQLFTQMLHEGIIVRPMGPYGLPTSLRITIGTRSQNDRMIAVLTRILEK